MCREEKYNIAITEDVLGRQECLDPKSLNLLTYSRPGDVCDRFESGRLGNMAGGFHFDLLGMRWRSSEHPHPRPKNPILKSSTTNHRVFFVNKINSGIVHNSIDATSQLLTVNNIIWIKVM